MSGYMQGVPEWIKNSTPYSDDLTVEGLLDRVNFLKGTYIEHTYRLTEQQERIIELEEMVELARAYERERIAQYMHNQGWVMTVERAIRESEDK